MLTESVMDMKNRIKAWRESKNYTHADIADYCGVTRSAVAQWELAEGTTPSHAHLAKLCEMLGISLAKFWGALPIRKVA